MDTALPTLNDSLTLYREEYLTGRNFTERTRRAYTDDMRDALAFLAEHARLTHPSQVGKFHLERYLAELDARGLAGATRRRKVAALRSFFGFLQSRAVIGVSPTLELIPPGRERPEPRVLSEVEYKRLQATVRFDPRDQAVIEILLQTGMRLGELANLTLEHIQLPARISPDPEHVGRVTIACGKGRRSRTVTLNWKACKAIKSYLGLRPKLASPYVFITKFQLPMGPRAIERAVAKYLAVAGIPAASVHTLRHTFATHQVKNGTKLDVVRQALGHASLATTSIYVSLAREEMDKELQANAL